MPVSRLTSDERDLDNAYAAKSELVCHALRLRPGQELKGALARFRSAKGIQAGFIITCVGSVRDVSLRLAGAERPSSAARHPPARQADCPAAPRPEEQQQQQLLPRPHHQSQTRESTDQEQQPMLHTGPDARFEICSLVGTLSPGGLHLHASLADEAGAICGGHLVRATVHTTAEIVIGVAPSLIFRREMDPSTGFEELVVAGPDTIHAICAFLFILVVLMVVFGVGRPV
ncbi:unnamed protein product [Scytosiphon promiscuus]